MSNLLKGYYTSLNTNDVRIIDSNAKQVQKAESSVNRIEPKAPDEDGFAAGLSADILSALTEEGGAESLPVQETEEEQVQINSEDYQDLLTQARAEIEKMQAEAQAEIEALADEAEAEAKQRGYEEGLKKARAEFAEKEQRLLQKENKLMKEYEEKIAMIEPQLVETLTGIYEHVFHVELGEQKEVITYLITSTLKKVDGGKNCIVHVSKEDYPYVSMQKKQIMSGVSSNTSLEIVEDITLSKNRALIETEGGIFDCGLGTQLSELNRKLRLLSYEKSE